MNDEGLVMGLSHVKYDVKGVQFHPESIMTPEGPKMIANWLKH
jgi:anthranilate synthase component 2